MGYLEGKWSVLAQQGLAITCEVQRGDLVAAISAAAATFNADLIVLATHGKTHLDAFWSGSFTPKLIAESRWPLLLVATGERAVTDIS